MYSKVAAKLTKSLHLQIPNPPSLCSVTALLHYLHSAMIFTALQEVVMKWLLNNFCTDCVVAVTLTDSSSSVCLTCRCSQVTEILNVIEAPFWLLLHFMRKLLCMHIPYVQNIIEWLTFRKVNIYTFCFLHTVQVNRRTPPLKACPLY